MGDVRLDGEGRVMRVDFDGFSVLNVYFPFRGLKPERQAFKLEFLQVSWHTWRSCSGPCPNLLIGADWNMCHRAIDIHNPIRLDGVPGFTPEERPGWTVFMPPDGAMPFACFLTSPINIPGGACSLNRANEM